MAFSGLNSEYRILSKFELGTVSNISLNAYDRNSYI